MDMLDFKRELYRLLEQEAQPLPEDGLAEIAGAGQQLLTSWNKKQSELSMQVEEIYDIVAGLDTSALSDALDSERKRAGELTAAVVTLCDILEDFYAFARESGEAALSEQARMMWKSAGNTLERLGFARLGEESQPLDPEIHTVQAAATSPVAREHVIRVLRSGYRYKGAVTRRAVVVVSAGMGESEQ